MSINTKAVKGRRALRFESVADAIADAESLASAERAGAVRILGNWSLGQALGHIAFWANAPYDGYPAMSGPPKVLKLLMPLFKKRFLKKTLPAGFRIPDAPEGTYGVDVMPTADGLQRLRAAFERLAATDPGIPNPVLGPMTHTEWIAINLRHAELHLSFFLNGEKA